MTNFLRLQSEFVKTANRNKKEKRKNQIGEGTKWKFDGHHTFAATYTVLFEPNNNYYHRNQYSASAFTIAKMWPHVMVEQLVTFSFSVSVSMKTQWIL